MPEESEESSWPPMERVRLRPRVEEAADAEDTTEALEVPEAPEEDARSDGCFAEAVVAAAVAGASRAWTRVADLARDRGVEETDEAAAGNEEEEVGREEDGEGDEEMAELFT